MVTNVPQLFDKGDREKTYILRDNNTLEYNISTRRLNVIEPTVIDILPQVTCLQRLRVVY